MSNRSKRAELTTCPDCGAVDSITVDDHLGEMACNECGLVVKGGLEQNPLDAYHDDQVTSASALNQLRGGGGKSKKEEQDFMYRVVRAVHSLRERFDAPEALGKDAMGVAQEYVEHLAESGSGNPSSAEALAVAAVHVSSLRMHFPLSQPQLLQEMAASLGNNAAHVVRDLSNAIVAQLRLQLPAPEAVLRDLVTLLLDRMLQGTAAAGLRFPQEPTLSMAAALAAQYAQHVGTPAEQRVVAAASIFLALTSRAAREQLAPRVVAAVNAAAAAAAAGADAGAPAAAAPVVAQVPDARQWAKEELTNLERVLARLIRDDSSALRSCIKHLMQNPTTTTAWIAAATRTFPAIGAPAAAGNAAAATAGAGSRREREQ